MKAQFLLGRLHSDGADDQGRFIADPQYLKATCFPLLDEFRSEDIANAFGELVEQRLVVAYLSDDEPLGQIVQWWRDQTGTYAYPSDLPPPPGWNDHWKVRSRSSKKSYETFDWPPSRDQAQRFLEACPNAVFLGTAMERSKELPNRNASQGISNQISSDQGKTRVEVLRTEDSEDLSDLGISMPEQSPLLRSSEVERREQKSVLLRAIEDAKSSYELTWIRQRIRLHADPADQTALYAAANKRAEAVVGP